MSTPTADQILDFLSRNRIRATYGAVGDVLGLRSISVGKALGPRCPRASWVVSRATGKPTGYKPHEIDPALTSATDLIQTAETLRRLFNIPHESCTLYLRQDRDA